MWKRMWRAFWTAIREPVNRYAPTNVVTVRVEVDDADALRRLEVLSAKAKQLQAEGSWLH